MNENHKDIQVVGTDVSTTAVRAEWRRPEFRKLEAREAANSTHANADAGNNS